ncbi:MAG TPA: dihydrofolate reductase family protein [Acidimicrobiales bacterium]|nr:dihydrofolate reductase family protein [Acidimicrobiales bacterium]
MDGKMILWMQVSADGYAAAADGSFDWPAFGAEAQRYAIDQVRDAGAFAYGATVYGWMASYWPTVESQPDPTPLDVDYSRIWVPMPKTVFSRTMTEADYNTTIARGNLATEVAALKERSDGDIFVIGGPTIARALIDADLIDEYRLYIHPVLLGGGEPLFPASDGRRGLRLVGSRTFDGASIHVHWARKDA